MSFRPRCVKAAVVRDLVFLLLSTACIAACGEAPQSAPTESERDSVTTVADELPKSRSAPPEFVAVGHVTAAALDEISGMQAGEGTDWWVHTDDGPPRVHAIGTDGKVGASIALRDARNQDWEDMTRVPGPGGPLLVISDSGDNEGMRKNIQLYFYPLPVRDAAGQLPGSLDLLHRIDLRYPDGPRDCESAAFDPVDERILLVTKRDVPPRIYGISLDSALSEPTAELVFLGEMARLRPPTPLELVRNPSRGAWISQPTGMDISPDGRIAVVITYRSLYLFQRGPEETWSDALARAPLEIEGPPGFYEEAVSFSRDQRRVMVTSENLPAPVYQLDVHGLFTD